MSGNRHKNSHSLHGPAVFKWMAAVIACSLLGAGYVAQKNQVLRLASEVRSQEVELNAWKQRNLQIRSDLAQLGSLGTLQRRLNGLGSGMVRIGDLPVIHMEKSRTNLSPNSPSGRLYLTFTGGNLS